MAFKLKSKGQLFGINEELSEFGRPVFEKKLDSGVVAEANRDGTTFVDSNASDKQKREAISHENVHHDQMAQGRLQYNNEEVTWKKDTKSPARVYKRVGGALFSPAGKKLTEGDSSFEWEDEAYKKQ
jgi:hypothetical protein